MTNAHLSDRDIHTLLIDPETSADHLHVHLRQCEQCRTRFNLIREFTTTFQTHIEEAETDWITQKHKILSALPQSHALMFRWRLATAVIIPCLVIAFALVLRHIYVQKEYASKVDETEISENAWVAIEERPEIELPPTILLLGEWGREAFPQFLNFFTPIEEVYDEQKDSVHNSIHTSGTYRSVVIRCTRLSRSHYRREMVAAASSEGKTGAHA
jgi:hypothetical protein